MSASPGSPASVAAMSKSRTDYDELKERNRKFVSENRRLRAILTRIQRNLSDI